MADLLNYAAVVADGEYSYPIVTFAWLVLRGSYRDGAQTRAALSFAKWALGGGQDYSEGAGNTRLAPHVIRAGEKALQALEPAEAASP